MKYCLTLIAIGALFLLGCTLHPENNVHVEAGPIVWRSPTQFELPVRLRAKTDTTTFVNTHFPANWTIGMRRQISGRQEWDMVEVVRNMSVSVKAEDRVVTVNLKQGASHEVKLTCDLIATEDGATEYDWNELGRYKINKDAAKRLFVAFKPSRFALDDSLEYYSNSVEVP